MGHIDVSGLRYELPNGTALLDDIAFRAGDGQNVALVGANGAGKTTLMRIISGEIRPQSGSVVHSGSLGVMRQFIGSIRDDTTVRGLLVSVASSRIKNAAETLKRAERALASRNDEKSQLRYAEALVAWSDAGGYDAEVFWDVCCTNALGLSFDDAKDRHVRTLSGGEQKRLVLEALLHGPDDLLLLDEPDNFLDVSAKRWLEECLHKSEKTVLYISHDRELLANTATRVLTLELQLTGQTCWMHPAGYATYHQARLQRSEKLAEQRRRWDEEHAKLKAYVALQHRRAVVNDHAAQAYKVAQNTLRRFEEGGPPQEVPLTQSVKLKLRGGRTGKRAVICEQLAITGLLQPFDAEIWYGDRVAITGSNGSGKSHFLRVLARGGSHPEPDQLPAGDLEVSEVPHTGLAKLGARVRPGWFAQTHEHPEFVGKTLLEILNRGDSYRVGMALADALGALARYELGTAGGQGFEELSGGQQARFQILLLELSGATLLLLDEPTDNLDAVSADALQQGLEKFQGTVVAATHDRWFARSFDRFLAFGSEGGVSETDEPQWMS